MLPVPGMGHYHGLAARLALVMTCLAPVGATAAASPGEASAGWEAVARMVREQLEKDPMVGHDEIDVEASGLLLTLKGTVGSRKERRRALEITRATAPPHTMVNDTLRVVSTEPPAPGPSPAANYRFWRGPAKPRGR
jgi:hypothetical protein